MEVFLVRCVCRVFDGLYQVPNFVWGQLPRPRAEVVTIATGRVASVAVCSLNGGEFVVPRLPSQDVSGGGRSRLVAHVRGDEVLQVVYIASGARPYVTWFLYVTPIRIVERNVTCRDVVLVSVDPGRQVKVQFAIRPGAIFSFGLRAPSAGTAAVSIGGTTNFVLRVSIRLVRVEAIKQPGVQAIGLRAENRFYHVLVTRKRSFLY